MKILYEDNHLLVVEKPINVPMQEDESKDIDLLSMGKAYLKEKYQKPGNVYLGLVHRLDRPVGGVVVFAKTSKAASRLSESIRKDLMIKTYEALVEGPLPQASTLIDYLSKNENTNTSIVTDEAHGKFCELAWEHLRSNGQRHHVRIHLKTGRSHQIRVQFASRRCPLIGDQRYNPKAIVGQQLALWAVELMFPHPTTHEPLRFESPAPFISRL
jgi:23S rRNA pseudouridine1911/1915/1917 synthase